MRITTIIVLMIIGIVAFDYILFYEPGLCVKDKYEWQIHIATKQLTVSKDLALKRIEKTKELNPNRTEAIRLEIVALQSSDRYDLAQKSILQLKKKDPFYYYANGINQLRQQNLTRAEYYLKEGIAQFPYYAPNYYVSAIVNFRMGNKNLSYLRTVDGLKKINISYKIYQYEKYTFIEKEELIGLLFGIKEYLTKESFGRCKKYYPMCVRSTKRNLRIQDRD